MGVGCLEFVADPRRVATDQRAQCQRQQGDASLNLEFSFIQAAKSSFVMPHGLKYRLCFRIPIANFLGEFGIQGMLESPAGFEPALPP